MDDSGFLTKKNTKNLTGNMGVGEVGGGLGEEVGGGGRKRR